MYGIRHLYLAVASLAAIVSSTAVNLSKRDTPLSITLSEAGNAVVKATITNTGNTSLTLLNAGTILDSSAAVKKVDVFSGNNQVVFTGIYKSILRAGLPIDAFTSIAAGTSVDITVDTAAVGDLSAGGNHTFVASGTIPYAMNSTSLTGAITYSSNVLSMEVDGPAAAAVHSTVISTRMAKRTSITSTCTGAKLTKLKKALGHCKALATKAATAATSGSASKFKEYFKTTSSSARSTVTARLKAVATECSTTSDGSTTYYCTDEYSDCSSGVLAYTLPSQNDVVSCPLYFSDLPILSGTCHAQDMSTTTLHEFTHADGIYSPGTADNAYGYASSTALGSAKAILNADTYALYANALHVGC